MTNPVRRYDQVTAEVSIVLVGKYTKLSDSYISLIKSLRHSALAIRRKLALKVQCGQALCDTEDVTTVDNSFLLCASLHAHCPVLRVLCVCVL